MDIPVGPKGGDFFQRTYRQPLHDHIWETPSVHFGDGIFSQTEAYQKRPGEPKPK